MNSLLIKAAPWAVAVLLGLGLKYQYDSAQQAKGAARLILQQAAPQRDSLRVLKDSLARATVVQKETLRIAVVRRVPVLDTVEVFLRDTVPVPVEVVRELVRVDSQVIAACTIALGTCEEEKSALRADLRLSQQQTDAFQKLVPSGFAKARGTITTAGLVLALCYIIPCPTRR